MIIPIIIPVTKKEYRCPNCNKIEKKIETCAHCNYHYPEEKTPWWAWVLVPIVLLVMFVVLMLIIRWVLFPLMEIIFFM